MTKPSAAASHPTNPGAGAPGNGKRKTILRIVAVVAAVIAVYFIVKNYLYEGTDDAYVEAHALMLAPRISGTITKVLVEENDKVKAGQVLAQLDDQDYSAEYNQDMADEASVQAQLVQAQNDYVRDSQLYKDQAVSKADYDAALARYRNLAARLQSDQFKADQAKLNLSYTQVTAPDDGVIAKRSVEVGMVVPAGQALFGFVSSSQRWVTADFKETQLSRIKIGQKVTVDVDAISGKTFQGEVESIGPATGSTFTLLPPDNSTGNFTKVVQRVPVRIKFLNLAPDDIDRLAAGLSCEVDVKVH